ncbi:hypothetical protein SAMN04487839_10577 [Streptococcus gallolyticus]|uniref:Conjugal transfer protein n=1 Tax=Streptococcus gallolyticus TaxID=315405 RepID=A0A1H7WE12_9STRE|nr:hypothetical protein [Streptococcus gallolyticus]SEF23530.1 hypothetical protein SAMN02910295_1769 [Streptococcus gallolyticus]SEM19822.1 hypothetical protein SAMN04487839_10577 [Streptococcus gallolyticus]
MSSEDTTSILVNLYNKISGVSIFDLKAYIEPTASLNISAVWKILTEIFVNGPFMILDLIVGFISLILRFFESFDLYDVYKNTVYDTSKNLWNGLAGSGNYNNSLLYLVIAVTAFSIFIGYTFSKGDVGRRLLHLFAVIMLGLGYFGTMQNTSGGIYVLDTIHNVATSASTTISNMSIVNPENDENTISSETSVADNYIARTAYAAYVYVNTGRLDGKYMNNQTGATEDFDDSKVLGSVVDGKFQKVNVSERDSKKGYLNLLGQNGADGEEQNRWVSAVGDYIVIKCLYVVLKIVEAIILGLPLILIQIMSFVAQLLVIFLMIAFPLALIVSLAPRLQDVIFNTIKLMLGASFFPVLTGFLTLMVFYIEAIINVFVSSGFDSLSEQDLVSFSDFQPVFELVISTVVQAIVFVAIWKNKEKVLTFILGHNQANSVARLADGVVNAPSQFRDTGGNMYERASDMATMGMLATGAGAGLALTAKDGLEKAFSKFKPDYGEVTPDSADNPDYDDQFEDMGNPSYSEDDSTVEEVEPDMADVPLYDEGEPSIEDDSVDYDGVYQESLADDSLDDNENVSIEDFEQDLSSEEAIDYHQQADNAQSDKAIEDYSTDNFSKDSAIEEVEVPQTESPLTTSDELPNDYRTYRKQAKVDKLEDELSHYQSSDDLGQLETGQSAFKRGLAKTTTKNRQYRMNKKRMSDIEQRLAELRGE